MSRLGIIFLIQILALTPWAQSSFVSVVGHQMRLNGKRYTFVGANYWYGSLLPLEKDKKRGIERLRHELDFLKGHGVTNLRLMAGVEGSGPMNGVTRVGPSLQPEQGKFDDDVLKGLDALLAEMGKRKMKAVIFLSNNWEWSGGFQQYLIWNKVEGLDLLTRKPDWDELRDIVAKFYTCQVCVNWYIRQAEHVIDRTNSVNGKRYVDDSTIMAWELANEPRPMRPTSNRAYKEWIDYSSSIIKSLDRNHLVTLGGEGWIGTVDKDFFQPADLRNIDYLTIHIWPKNWGWLTGGNVAKGFDNAAAETKKYLAENLAIADKLGKPLVIEEFGLPRDGQSLDPKSSTAYRDRYFELTLNAAVWNHLAGANFWAFGGTAKPISGQPFWKPGDDRMGDPPMEEQGLNSVFESDRSTWAVIDKFTRRRSATR